MKTNIVKEQPKVTYSVALVLAFLSAENENQQLEDLPPADFGRLPEKLLLSVRKNSIYENFVNWKNYDHCIFCNHDSTHFFLLRVSANALYDCYSGIVDSFICIHLWSRLFFSVKGYCVYVINKIITFACRYGIFSSRVQLDIWLVRCAFSWAIELNTRKAIPYLRAPMYYSLFIIFIIWEMASFKIIPGAKVKGQGEKKLKIWRVIKYSDAYIWLQTFKYLQLRIKRSYSETI